MCNDIVLIALNDVYLNIVLARKYHFRARNYLCCQVEVSFSEMALSASFYIVTVITSVTSKVRTRKDMFHFIQLYVRFGGLGAEGFEEKNGFDGVIKLLVYARGE